MFSAPSVQASYDCHFNSGFAMPSSRQRSLLICGLLMARLIGSLPVFAEDQADRTWDKRLNGIWVVTSVVLDGEPVEHDVSDCKYAILDGVVVSASPISRTFMSEQPDAKPFGQPAESDEFEGDEPGALFPAPADERGAKPPEPAEPTHTVDMEVSRATVTKKQPYSWIDLETQWEERSEKQWPGIYHIEGDKLTLAFGEKRPTKLESPKVDYGGFTRPSPVSKVITLVRQPRTGPDNRALQKSESD